MTPPLVSCIVPVYNGERYLGETLDSIVAQTHRPIEIIVVDDGSTDRSAAVAEECSAGVRLLRQRNAGPAAARNHGVREAVGSLVAFLDADDLWHPEKLERQVARFQARDELGFCVTHIQNFWVPELEAERRRFQGSRLAEPLPGYSAPTLVVRATTLATVGEFRESMAHTSEPEWFMRASERGVIGELLPDVLVRRRLHLANRSRLRSLDSTEEYLRLVKGKLDRARQGQQAALPRP